MAKYLLADYGKKSGIVDGSLYQRNGIERNIPSGANGFSAFRNFIYAGAAFYSEQWQLLSQSDMQCWHNFYYIKKNVWNQNIYVSGIQAFIGLNMNLAIVLNDNTAIHLTRPLLSPISRVLLINTSIVASPLTMVLDCFHTPRLSAVEVSASPNLSPGIFKPRRCNFSYIGTVNLSLFTSDIYLFWINHFGTVPSSGSKIFIRTKAIDINTGLPSTVQQCSCIVT